MKQVSTNLSNALKTGTALRAVPVVIVDWNLNRYHDVKADNNPSEQDAGFDVELFPVESIAESNRPDKGINKARVGYSRVIDDYAPLNKSYLPARFYVADVDDVYKYWTSPLPAVNGVVPVVNATNFTPDEFPDITTYDGLTSARPFVTYGTWDSTDKTGQTIIGGNVDANKIVIKLENSWATPADFDIVISASGKSTVVIHDEDLTHEWRGTGNIVLRWDGTKWSDTLIAPLVSNEMPVTTPVQTIQLVVRTLGGGYEKTPDGQIPVATQYLQDNVWKTTDGKNGFVDVIEIAAHLEADISAFVMEDSSTLDIGEVSNLYPIGTVTSNVGSLTLSNLYRNPTPTVPDTNGNLNEFLPGAFSQRNTAMIWHNYLEPNAKVDVFHDFYDESGSSSIFLERVQELSMYTGAWTGQESEEVAVDLSDYSTFFNTQLVPSAMWENIPATEAVWRVLDTVGFSNYVITSDDNDFNIPIFYMDSTQNVWEIMDSIAQSTQTAIYFDSYGTLHVKPRGAAFKSDPMDDTLTSVDSAGQLANIVSLDQTEEFEPNSITVTYQATDWTPDQAGNPVLQEVWAPEGDEVVRSSPLVKSLTASIATTNNKIWLSSANAEIWPFEGLVNIDGEMIAFKGKEITYDNTDTDLPPAPAVMNSLDDFNNLQGKIPVQNRYKTKYTGVLIIDVDDFGALKRGQWNTIVRDHLVDAAGYSIRHVKNGTHRSGVGGFQQLSSLSKVQLASTTGFNDYKDILIATHGATADTPYYYYGTKFRFVKEKGRTTQKAGMVLHNNDATEDGYYIELMLSKDLNGKTRKGRQEMILYSRVAGKDYRKGTVALAIGENIDYEIDVTYANVGSSDHKIMIWVNGKKVMDRTITTNKNTPNGRFGMFLRGKTKVQYEYLYGIAQQLSDLPDDFSYMDRVRHGYIGKLWDKEFVYEDRWRNVLHKKTVGKGRHKRVKKWWTREQYRFDLRFFDDFGPYVHEVREYNVKFDPSPVQHSQVFMTNDWGAAVLEYRATPFDATFVVANADRINAVINGDDTLSYAGTGESVSQVLDVLGRVLVVADGATVVAENKQQINARGKNESDLSGPWIQTKDMAQGLANWINDNFTYGNDGLSVEVFGNPCYEIGDVVHVTYPDKQIDGDFFIIGVSNTFSSGYTTTLTLRERHNLT